MSTETNVLIPLKFKDDDELINLRDKSIIEKIPIIERAMSLHSDDWKSSETVLSEPMTIPFKRCSGEFLFDNVLAYKAPDLTNEFVTPDSYKAAVAKSLDELKDIIELANFFECTDFVQAMGYVIGTKLEDKPVEFIADYMGVVKCETDDGYDEDNEWMHPPVTAMKNRKN